METSPLVLETRKLKDDKREVPFQFLVVDSPEKWQPAREVPCVYDMPIVGSSQKMRFNCRAISSKEWEFLEASHPIPQWIYEGDPPEDHKTNQEKARSARTIATLELALDKKFPGETFDEKLAVLNNKMPGEIDSLMIFVHRNLCNWDKFSSELLAQYELMIRTAPQEPKDIVEFSGFENWLTASEVKYFYRMCRPQQDYILEFPLRGLTKNDKERFDTETKEPQAPMVPAIDSTTKKIKRGEMIPNTQDPNWIKVIRGIAQKRTVLILEACLPFTIPGTDIASKYEWIAERPIGDLSRLKTFIEEEFLSYGSRLNSFLNG